MLLRLLSTGPAVLLPVLAAPALAVPGEQAHDGLAARQATRDGRILPLPEIERRVVPTMKGAQYIGVDLEMPSGVYTLKFLRDGSVIWVDVDGRTGQVIGRTGH
ncbi:hypothetical protein COA17_12590 [Sphingomonas ginsenosidimutans]|uniref:PepSY domain-containing protein n=1 Tax=Sphingomonas ginsenosidimutans TaxID=862134 RepID=A0A2A4HXV1_9SPHN|nr:hypothetical protein [Sphingomonas ginsenosidimutans]PCG08508.1 hypothetical protein COA17_12590 [Sphingomonas ginsenosidimutans]